MILNELAKKDKYWRSIAYNICKDKELSKDLVQDMYLRLNKLSSYEKLFKNGVLSKSYVWITLRNLQFQQYNMDKLTISLNNYDIQLDENCTCWDPKNKDDPKCIEFRRYFEDPNDYCSPSQFKIEDHPDDPQIIATARGVGYRLMPT